MPPWRAEWDLPRLGLLPSWVSRRGTWGGTGHETAASVYPAPADLLLTPVAASACGVQGEEQLSRVVGW